MEDENKTQQTLIKVLVFKINDKNHKIKNRRELDRTDQSIVIAHINIKIFKVDLRTNKNLFQQVFYKKSNLKNIDTIMFFAIIAQK